MTTVQIRMEDQDKKAAEKALKELGLDLPTAIRMFLKKVAKVHGIPFPLRDIPEVDENGLTKEQIEAILQAEKEAEQGINVSPAFDNAKDAIRYLRSQTNED